MNKILELIEISEEIGISKSEKIVRFWKNWKEIKKRKEQDYIYRTWQQLVGCKKGYNFNTNYSFIQCTINTLKDYFEDKERLPEKTVGEIEFILDYGQTKLVL